MIKALKKGFSYYFNRETGIWLATFIVLTTLFMVSSGMSVIHHVLYNWLIFSIYSMILVYLIAKPLRKFVIDSKLFKILEKILLEKLNLKRISLIILLDFFVHCRLHLLALHFFGCIAGYFYTSSHLNDSIRFVAMKYYELPHYVVYPCKYYDYGNYLEGDFDLTKEQVKEINDYYNLSSNPYSRYSNSVTYYCTPPDREYDGY